MSRPAAIALWSALQCVALLVAAAGVRLWPHPPDPPESLALPVLVTVQIVSAALLFPDLFADRTTASVSLAVVAPALFCAGVLSATPPARVTELLTYVAVWMIGLSAWAQLARTVAVRAAAVCGALILSVGGALLWYVRVEAAAQTGVPPPDPIRYGPLTAAVALSTSDRRFSVNLDHFEVAVPLLSAVGPLAFTARRRRQRHLSK